MLKPQHPSLERFDWLASLPVCIHRFPSSASWGRTPCNVPARLVKLLGEWNDASSLMKMASWSRGTP